MAAPGVHHVWQAKLTAFPFQSTQHPLHLALAEGEFTQVNCHGQDSSAVVAVGRSRKEFATTGSVHLQVCVSKVQHQNQNIGHVTELSDVSSSKNLECQSQNVTLILRCTRKFLWHYDFKENDIVFIKCVIPQCLQKVVIGAKNEEAFAWIQQTHFMTGLLLSVCEQKVLFRKDDVLLVPYNSLYGAFDMNLLFDFNIVETSPFNQGLLTVKTELVVVCIYQDCVDLNFNPASQPLCHETSESPALLSDFTSSLNQKQVGALTFKTEAREQILEVDVMRHCHIERITGLNEDVDLNSIICIPEKTMKTIGLFEGCLIELVMPSMHVPNFEQPEKSENSKNKRKKMGKRKKHIAVVKLYSEDAHDGTSYISPASFFNIGCQKDTERTIIMARKYHSDTVKGIYSSSLSEMSCLPYATEMHISIVQSPNYSQTTSLDNLLQKYFTTTRILKEGDVVCLATEDDPEYYQSLDDVTRIRNPNIYVVVTQIIPHVHGCHGCRVDIRHSSVYQKGTVHAFVPPGLSPTSDGRCHLHASEVGLGTYVDKLIDLSHPHLIHRKECQELLPTFLLSGPSACGKSLIAKQVAARLNMHLYQVDCHEMCRETRAATEAKVKAVMHRAATFSPCVLLLSGIQVIGKMPENSDEDPRLISVFLELLRQTLLENKKFPIIAIATTHVAEGLSAELQEGFLHHVSVEVPDEETRVAMLSYLVRHMSVAPDVSVKHIAQRTAGLVLGDLQVLCNHTRSMAIQRLHNTCFPGRYFISLEDEADLVNAGIKIQSSDFSAALDLLQAAHSDAIGAPKIPNVSWDDVGGLINVKADILDTIQLPLEHPELFAAGLRRSGVLLYGPPGVGKTLLAKAVATECSLNFLSVKGPELINMYVGQSEENVRQVFARARDASPCVIFFDELDSLAPNRGRSGDSGGVMDRVVSQLLAELDGLHKSCDVFVIGATNRPDLLDPALLRPGRFDKLLYLGVSEDKDSQLNIMKALTRKFSLAKDCLLEEIVEHCPSNLTGADFYALCSDAMLNAMKRKIAQLDQGIACDQSHIDVEKADFLQALSTLIPSVSAMELQNYQSLQTFYNNQK